MQKNQRQLATLIIVGLALVLAFVSRSSDTLELPPSTDARPAPVATSAAQSVERASRTSAPSSAAPQQSADRFSIAFEDLPPEAQQTIELIEGAGPFPYAKDGSVFQNRERLLPQQPSGYYREYTVETPGSDDRGARRIVAGRNGELFYTDDHYDSFRRIR